MPASQPSDTISSIEEAMEAVEVVEIEVTSREVEQ
jgi:hypothetical protein